MENTAVPAATVWPGSTLRMLMLPEIGASSRVSFSRFRSSLAWASAACACACAVAISSLRVPSWPFHIARVRPCRPPRTSESRSEAGSFVSTRNFMRLYSSSAAFEVDAGLFQFLFPNAGVSPLLDGLRRFLLRLSPR